MAAYGFIASVLPVWMLLCPRDYLSSYLKIGTIAFLIIGVILVASESQHAGVHAFHAGGGPVIPGKLYPFVFITIACGAISGFHALISSGTTPKMIAKETDTRMIGYGSMLMEGVVGVVALIAATSLFPGDYFAINTRKALMRKKPRTRNGRYAHAAKGSTCNRRRSIDSNRNQARRTCADAPAARHARTRHRENFQRHPRSRRVDEVLVSLRDHV